MLDPVHHAQLIADLDQIARDAGVPKRYIEDSMGDYGCQAELFEWVKGYKTHAKTGCYGLALIDPDATQKLSAITGAFIRNFVLARMVTLSNLLEEIKEGPVPDPTILVIPSFERPGITQFQANALWGFLEDRMLRERLTICAVKSTSQVASDFGKAISTLIANHFQTVVA